jgi:ATP-binding cassette subfamily B multidrug efflux pump
VEQSFRRVPGTVRDQITLFDAAITPQQAEDAARTVGLHDAIAALPEGYDTPCTPGIFSQGQWQLLSIARAIAAGPQILLLDEITANLDAGTDCSGCFAARRSEPHRGFHQPPAVQPHRRAKH